MNFYRIIRSACFVGAVAAPPGAVLLCRFASALAVKYAYPTLGSEKIPGWTELWIFPMANGEIPIVAIAFFVSALLVAFGLYIFASRRLAPDAALTILLTICSAGYASAFAILAFTVFALPLPFVRMWSNLPM
jgi:hypothetical protein